MPGIPAYTMEAFTKSFENGADAVSIMVHVSSDGFPVAAPSAELEKFSTAKGLISDSIFRDLQSARINQEGQSIETGLIMSLDDILKSFPDKKFIITVMDKNASSVDAIIGTINDENASDRVLIDSPHGKVISQFRKQMPGIATSFSLMGIVGIYSLFRSGLLAFKKSFSGDALVTPETMGTSYIASGTLISVLNTKNIKVFVRSDDSESSMRRVFESGVDGIITTDVPRAIKVYRDCCTG